MVQSIPMVIKRKSITLIEVLISMGLLVLLMGSLLSIYLDMSKMDILVTKDKQLGEEYRRLDSRFIEIFTHLLPPEKDKIFFYTEGEELIFCYDRGAQVDPTFSGVVLGKLFVDETGALVLYTWPLGEKEGVPPVLKERLLEEVEQLLFTFYVPPKKDIVIESQAIGEEVLVPPSGFLHHWVREYEKLPPLVYLRIVGKNSFDFVFYLPQNSYPLSLLKEAS